MPGQVESYDHDLQVADIQVTVKNGTTAENGDRRAETIAVLTSVPVLHAGGGGFRVVFPVKRGDTVLVVFASRSITRWLINGGVVDPKSDHHHDLSDAVAITGLRDLPHALTNSPATHASVGHDTGATIEFYPTEIRVGGDSGTQPTIMGTTYRAAENQMLDLMSLAFTALLTNPTIAAWLAAAPAPVQASIAGFAAGITAFKTGGLGYLTSVAKVV